MRRSSQQYLMSGKSLEAEQQSPRNPLGAQPRLLGLAPLPLQARAVDSVFLLCGLCVDFLLLDFVVNPDALDSK